MTDSTNKNLRNAINHSLDAMEEISYQLGFAAAADSLDELSDIKHNQDQLEAAEVLRWAAMELRGEND
jgi:cation transport regulator ChaB